jgi:acetyltransferase
MVQLTVTRTNVSEQAGATAQEASNVDLVTRSGYGFHVRCVEPSDEAALAELFTHVDKEDLRFRFFAAIHKVAPSQLHTLVNVDHDRTENFLAIEHYTGLIIATAMLVCDQAQTSAEVAIAVHSNFKNRGISWTLLDHVGRFAVAKGIQTLESIENRDNHEAIELERARGWKASSCSDDPTLIVLRLALDSVSA